MKKIICLILAIIFYIIGIIGLILPIVPQIPFLAIGTMFLCIGFSKIKHRIIKSKFYNQYIKKYVESNKILLAVFDESN